MSPLLVGPKWLVNSGIADYSPHFRHSSRFKGPNTPVRAPYIGQYFLLSCSFLSSLSTMADHNDEMGWKSYMLKLVLASGDGDDSLLEFNDNIYTAMRR